MKKLKLFKRFIILSFLFLLQLAQAQQYSVQVTPVLIPPYSLKLGDYATTNENKLQLQLLMTDLMEPSHQVRLRFSLESGLNATPIAISNQFVNGMRDITLSPGVPLILTNVELRALFQLQNLSGISASDYAKTLPQGQYNFCFEVVDVNTGRTLSRKSCSTAYFVQYDPPMLSLPQNKELVQKQNEIQNIVFQWMPRQVAPNTRYIFTMKEIWDLQRDPVTAFLASPVLWKEEVYSNSLFYGFDKTQLLPGKRYAWQVQARSGNPVLGGNPTEDNGVYKNNGLSEIFYFDYIQDCKVPSFLSAKNAGRGRVEVRWSYPGEKPNGLYRIQYRKRGSTTAWMEQEAYQEMIYISGLADKTEYEYRVGAICGLAQTYNNGYENGTDNAYSYSNTQYFTTDSEDTSNTVQCGMMPNINITNKAPLQDLLVANDVFTAGDFPVTVIKSTGSGTYSGEGYIVVPYLADTKVKVSFNNIQINTDRQLISGVIETTYDPNESAVHYVSGTIDGIFGDGGIKEINVDYPIDSVVYSATPPPGTITVIGPPGKNGEEPPRQTYEGGKDTTITGPDGTIWEVDKDGNITKGGEVAPGGSSSGQNTDGVSGSGKDAVINQYTAKGIELEWKEIPFKNKETPYTKFSFDTQDKTNLPISDYQTVKDSKGQTIAVPYKLVVNGQTDILQADVKLTDTSLKDEKIIFKTLRSGKKIEATETKLSDTNRRYELTLKGAYNYEEEDVIAVIVPKDSLAKQQVVSSFKLVHLKEKKAKVHLVPLDDKSKTDLTKIRENLTKVYKGIGVDFEIVEEPILPISELGINDKIESGDPKIMSTYGSDQKKINNQYLNTRSKELRYVLFVTDKQSSTGQAGYMRLNGQFGYVFKNAPPKTAAHELGHGIFKLEHPTASNTKLLMDYSESELLSHKDWQQIGDPAFKFYGFQDQSEGELAQGFGLSPNFDLFETDSNLVLTYDDIKLESGFVEGFINKGTDYYWDSTLQKYIDSNQNKYPIITTTPADNRFIWLVYNLDKECKERKFIRTLYREIKDIIVRKDKQALIAYITKIDKINRPKEPKDTDIYSGYLGCDESKNRTKSGGSATNQNGGGIIYDYGNVLDAKELEKVLSQIKATVNSTGIKGNIFTSNQIGNEDISATEVKIKQQIEEIKQSTEKQVYIWAKYKDGKFVSLEFGYSKGVETGKRNSQFEEYLAKIQDEIFGDFVGGEMFNPLTAIFDGLTYVISQLEIPAKFYDPAEKDYNPIFFKFYQNTTAKLPSEKAKVLLVASLGVKATTGITNEHIVFAYNCGNWDGIVGLVKGLSETGALLSKGIQAIFDKEMQAEISNAYDKWIANCDKSTTSTTYTGCAWDMLKDAIVEAHSGGTPIQNAHQYGKTTIDVISIPVAFIKAGKIGQINKLAEVLDPLNQVMKFAGKGVSITFKGVGKTTGKAFVYVFDQARKLEKYEVRFATGKLYAGVPFPEFRKKLDDVVSKTDLDKIPVDENGIRILEVDGEAIPIGPEGKIDELVNQVGKASLLTKFKDFTNIKTWINGLDDVADAGLLAKLDNLEPSYFSKLDADLIHSTYGPEIKALVKESPDDLTDIWKRLKDDPAYSWEIQKTGGSRWEKWGQREFFKDITAKGKGFETNVCLTAFKNRTSAKYLELKNKFHADFGKNLDDYDMYSQVQLKYDGDNYFVADQLFVKYKTNALGQQVVDDIVVIENKLSSTTPLTTPQANALTKTSFTVRSNDINSATPNGSVLIKGTKLDFSNSKQWYKVHDGVDGNIITGISKM